MNSPFHGVACVTTLGVIRATGEDAARFLHSQLTQDFLLLQPGQARLAAFCTAKGRMSASFIAFAAAPQDYLLLCSRDLLAPTLKRLSMFVLRAKVKLSDATGAFDIHGLAGEALAPGSLQAAAPWQVLTAEDGALLVTLYPADGVPRALRVAPAGSALPPGLAVQETDARWRLSEVRSGVATVSAAVVEAFVPQMLNYESVDGVNFKKGCYPGQEVVARSQFRGTLKRRAVLASADVPLQAGQELFAAADPEQAAATVVQAAATPQGGSEAIVSGQLSAFAAGELHLGSADGPLLRLRAMPYALREDI